MTTRDEIATWFNEGVSMGESYMVVVCDTYDYEDYPVCTKTREEAQKVVDNPGRMQKVMEVYDLKADRDKQLMLSRCWALE